MSLRPLWATLGGVVLLAAGVWGAGRALDATARHRPPSAAERAALPAIGAFAPVFGTWHADPADEQAEVVEYADGSRELRWRYADPDVRGAPWVEYTVALEPTAIGARVSAWMQWYATLTGFARAVDRPFRALERPDVFAWGDATRFAILEVGGRASGNLLVARRGGTVVYLLLSGAYFDDPFTFAPVVTPWLEALDSLPPP